MRRSAPVPSTPLAPALLVLLVAAGCASGGAAASAGASGAASVAASFVVSPGAGAVADAEQAAALVLAQNPAFAGIVAKDPDLIGQGSWYEVTPIDGGWQVLVEIGWGDCQSGCIDRHDWTYVVSPDGRVGLIREEGPAVPSEGAIDY
jgi:hypothetical protein